MKISKKLERIVKEVCPTYVSGAFLDYTYRLAENVIQYDKEIDYQYSHNCCDEELLRDYETGARLLMDDIEYHYMYEDVAMCLRCAMLSVMKYKRGDKTNEEPTVR